MGGPDIKVRTRSNWTFADMAAPGDTSSSVNVSDFHLPHPKNSYDEFPHEGSSMPTLQGFTYFTMNKEPQLENYHETFGK